MLPGRDQNVRGGLRVDVLEGEHAVIFVDDFCRNFLRADLAEQAIVHGWPPSWESRCGYRYLAGGASRRTTKGCTCSFSRSCSPSAFAASSEASFPTRTR